MLVAKMLPTVNIRAGSYGNIHSAETLWRAMTTDSSIQRFELQRTLFERGFEQVQRQIIHLDDALFKIKASAMTVWVALIGWAFTSGKPQISLLGFVVIIGFWLLEAIFKGAQIRYMEVSTKLIGVANDTDLLQKQFEKMSFDDVTIYPVDLNLTEMDRLVLMGRGLVSPTIATIYLFLAFANLLVWLAVSV